MKTLMNYVSYVTSPSLNNPAFCKNCIFSPLKITIIWDVTPCGLTDEHQTHFYHDGSRDFFEMLEPIYKNIRPHIEDRQPTSVPFGPQKHVKHSWPKACSNTSLWIIQIRRAEQQSKSKHKFSKSDFFPLHRQIHADKYPSSIHFHFIQRTIRSSNPDRDKTFLYSTKRPERPIQLPIQWVQEFIQRCRAELPAWKVHLTSN